MCTTPHFLAYFLSALSRTHFTHFHTCTCGRWWKVPAAADPQQNAVRRRLIIRVPCRLIGTCIAELAAVGHLAFRYVDLSELESSPPTGQVLDETAPRVDKTAAPRPSLFPNGACTATGSSKGPGTETAADFPECFTAAHSSEWARRALSSGLIQLLVSRSLSERLAARLVIVHADRAADLSGSYYSPAT